MSNTFPPSPRGAKGYRRDRVDAFFDRARYGYEGPHGALSARDVREVRFPMRRSGYSTVHVDAALDRLEDALIRRDQSVAEASTGTDAWLAGLRADGQEIVDRLARPEGRRFRRMPWPARGYHRREVDQLANRILAHFTLAEPMNVEEVRQSAFRGQRGGYDEAQVDAVLAAVVHLFVAVE